MCSQHYELQGLPLCKSALKEAIHAGAALSGAQSNITVQIMVVIQELTYLEKKSLEQPTPNLLMIKTLPLSPSSLHTS